ncbi:DNA-formamidopyrimidine glycosylase [Lentilactobacillus hilgardii]|uniref:Formamidopyrimidine-DNA glycosylase n=1 Tax=Lentilactobacillus hilgardii (strain ATCC 8290 / DSM 20176 / CCUG 30140 / JCM 1155 / KCTC 3500 / NBRC 15886 / NCIMB 8040 / NRRL B-1843 / 9) TaxID=1423757 RepID=C0XMD6_LENH9|nr:DNA-formamidopyrimidine glycosylase [Lentilactobacillus hilgardii]EEI23484.1 DNA-formamidopyrimidine glycosylase [Lentilactobacillus hilgardii DSM 20176 = ATCC 8290]KRK58390.1 DNA-(apurinic or apyrimidinic site) lyase [Lentilactobacillus hilgardii DSM 20176 = ATCC 8290]MCP9332147.1 DNA-formamidopyrimidine glycosylase [Lentilactobacillus hilgardii]MCP9350553.1 DNA-formamidopyrimidine glycosylase [Lentilactobacillus hilgardii]MCP9351458.1 DNA-formamidopyrimidine glycosylase [Lentilactobacillu
MPELPEVETVRRGLTELVAGSQIRTVDVLYPKMINLPPEDFTNALKNQIIKKIDRRGKYLFIRINNGLTIVSHLRMEGKYDVEPEGTPLSKHTHIVFHLTDGRQLRYNDTRKFGRMNLVDTGHELTVAGLKTIGPEPTERDLTLDYMRKIFGKSKKLVKPFLLDQSNIAGLGNIYADEVLWLSKINPKQPVNTLSVVELKLLRKSIIDEIKRAIDGHGTTVHSYSNAYGEAGNFQNHLNVYGRQGEPCLRCGTPIEKIKLAQRGTHFCPNCQVIHGDRHE